MRRLLIIIIVILLAGLILNKALEGADFLNRPKDQATAQVANLFYSLRDFFHSVFEAKNIIQENERLLNENQNLSAELKGFNLLKEENKKLRETLKLEEETSYNYHFAYVLSSSPFNIQNLLIIGVGSSQGIETRMPVLWGKNILVGYVSKISPKSSEVIDIFNSNLKLPVWVGQGRNQAILQGGSRPYLDLIPKDSPIKVGEPIYSNGNFFIGEIEEFKEETSEAFKEAFIKLPYQLDIIRDVLVVTNYTL